MIQPSVQLNNAIFDVLENRVGSIYQITSAISGNYSLDVQYFEGMGIIQNFESNFTDQISATIKVYPKELLAIITNYQDLKFTITLTPVNIKTFRIYDDRNPIIFTGRMLINNPQDILKKYNVRQLIAEEDTVPLESQVSKTLPLSFQIINNDTYNLKKKEVNVIFTNTSMDKIISYLTDQLGIKNTNVKKVDNQDKMTNVIIPPGQDISSVFKHLQEKYGVYSKGLKSYISGDTLHIYPGFETEASDYTTTFHVINAPKDYIPGEEGYHRYKDKDLYVVAIGGCEVSNLMEAGIEHIGDTKIALQSDRIVDHASTISEDGTVKINENIQALSLNTDYKPQSNSSSVKYSGESVNSYNHLSNMSQTNCSVASLVWTCAEPILMNPGQKCIFHYDNEDGVYKTTNGILSGISYTSSMMEHFTDKRFYSFNSRVVLRLTPEKKS